MRTILIAVIIIIFFAVVLPFFLYLAGFRILEFAYVGGRRESAIFRSEDGGRTWGKIAPPTAADPSAFSRIVEVEFHPFLPQAVFIVTPNAGVFRSRDGGGSWEKISSLSGAEIADFALSGARPNLMYAAVFDDGFGRVLKSESSGARFQEIYRTGVEGERVIRVWVDDSEDGRLLIATGGGGILETRDGGKNWKALKWFDSGIEDLIIRESFPSEFYILRLDGGVEASRDGGRTWTRIPLPDGNSSKAPVFPELPAVPLAFLNNFLSGEELAVSRSGGRLYAVLPSGVFKSSNGGGEWEKQGFLVPPDSPPDALGVGPDDPDLIFASFGAQFYRSEDGGVSWSASEIPGASRIRKIFVNPLNSDIIFLNE